MAEVTSTTTKAQLSFFARVKAELKKLFTHAPGWEASAAATLTYIAPLVETIVTLTDPAVAPAVDALIAKIQSAMAAAAVVIKDAGPAPTLTTFLLAVNNDIAQLEQAAGAKDPVTSTKLAGLLSTITAEIAAILNEVSVTKA